MDAFATGIIARALRYAVCKNGAKMGRLLLLACAVYGKGFRSVLMSIILFYAGEHLDTLKTLIEVGIHMMMLQQHNTDDAFDNPPKLD